MYIYLVCVAGEHSADVGGEQHPEDQTNDAGMPEPRPMTEEDLAAIPKTCSELYCGNKAVSKVNQVQIEIA
jgi:hypothetical protein